MALSTSRQKRLRFIHFIQDTPFGDSSTINNFVIDVPCDKQNYCNKMNEMRKNNQLCDVKLITGKGHEIWAHKIVLATHSEYFNIMFTSGFKENSENEVFMQEMNPCILSLLIDYMYTYEITINVENAVEVLKGICLLQLDQSLFNVCINFIKNGIEPSNCLDLIELGECLLLNDFRSFCWRYALCHYKDVCQTEDFLLISFDMILQMIKHEDICVDEEIVYNSVMKWIKHDIENRNKHLSELFKFVRLSLVTPQFLQMSVDTEELMKSNQDCKKYVTEAYIVQTLNGTGFEDVFSIRSRYRPKYSKYVLIISQSGRRHFPILYNVVSNEWKVMPISVPKIPGGLILKLDDGRIMDFGGFEYHQRRNSVIEYDFDWEIHSVYGDNISINSIEVDVNSASIYDLKENQWTCIEQMIYGHSDCSCVQVGNRVFVITQKRDEYEYYNITLNKWYKMNPSYVHRYHFKIIALDDFIYVVGGKSHNITLSLVERYNTKNNTWNTCADMRHKRFWPTLCVFENYIYAIGGSELPYKYLDTVEKYDPVTNEWTEVAPLNIKRSKAGAVSLNGSIYVFGGANSDYSIEVYCPFKNEWTLMSEKIPNVIGFNCMCQAFVIPQAIQNLYLNFCK